MRYVGLILLLGALAAVGGCIGKAGYAEEYLRVLGSAGECREQLPAGALGVAKVVGIRQIKASEGFDRQAVMLGKGRVLTASQRWFWEAAPARLVEQSLIRALNCSPGLAAAWPMRSGTQAALSVSGVVNSFTVQADSMNLEALFDCQLWDGPGTTLLAARSFSARVPVAGLDGQSIAAAASAATEAISGEAALWIARAGGRERTGK